MAKVKVITQQEVTLDISGKFALEDKNINGIKFFGNMKIIINVKGMVVEFIVPLWATTFRLVDDTKNHKSLLLVYIVTNTDIQSASDPESGGAYAWLPRFGQEREIKQITVPSGYRSM